MVLRIYFRMCGTAWRRDLWSHSLRTEVFLLKLSPTNYDSMKILGVMSKEAGFSRMSRLQLTIAYAL